MLSVMSGAPIIPRLLKQTTFCELGVSKLVKPGDRFPVMDHEGGRPFEPKISGRGQPLKLLEDKKMNRHELWENVAGYVAGITTGLAFVVLYVALAAPVAETVQKLIA